MHKSFVYEELLRLLANLRHESCDLRSKMTSLMLYVDESQVLSKNQKNCILNIVQTIASKDTQLISAEDQLAHVIDLLFNECSSTRKSYLSLLEEKKRER